MTRKIAAAATLDNGVRFSVELANVTERSVFMMTPHELSFRDGVALRLESLELRGEVVFVAHDHPRGAVVVFDASPEEVARLKPIIAGGEVLSAQAPDELWADSTEPAPDEVAGPGSTAEEPPIDPVLFQAAMLEDVMRDEDDTAVRPPISSLEEETDEVHENVFADLSFPEISEPTEPQPDDGPDDTNVGGQLPELASDGTLSFATADDFRAQYRSDIIKGGLIARSPPLPIGSQRMICVDVPGIVEAVKVSARVGFVGSGTVGLMIDSFAKHKQVFQRLFDDVS